MPQIRWRAISFHNRGGARIHSAEKLPSREWDIDFACQYYTLLSHLLMYISGYCQTQETSKNMLRANESFFHILPCVLRTWNKCTSFVENKQSPRNIFCITTRFNGSELKYVLKHGVRLHQMSQNSSNKSFCSSFMYVCTVCVWLHQWLISMSMYKYFLIHKFFMGKYQSHKAFDTKYLGSTLKRENISEALWYWISWLNTKGNHSQTGHCGTKS